MEVKNSIKKWNSGQFVIFWILFLLAETGFISLSHYVGSRFSYAGSVYKISGSSLDLERKIAELQTRDLCECAIQRLNLGDNFLFPWIVWGACVLGLFIALAVSWIWFGSRVQTETDNG